MATRPRILIADADIALLKMITHALEHHGAEVVIASCADELVERIADGPYALLVADVSMPWMGLQAMYSARNRGLSAPLLVLSMLRRGDIDAHIAALGGDIALLRKPFRLTTFESAVARLLHLPGVRLGAPS